jgi:hypothetical protein
MTTPGPQEAAQVQPLTHMSSRALASDKRYDITSDRCSLRLNTEEKHRTRRGLLDQIT